MIEPLPLPPSLVLLDVQADRHRWVRCLSVAGITVSDLAGDPPPTVPTVVVTDQEGPSAWRSEYAQDLAMGQIGVVGLGISRGVHVSLPADVSARELQLIVRLLAQLIWLRRQQRQARVEQHSWRELAMCDVLTDLPNRRAWQHELPLRIAADAGFCVALLDLDFFKQVNDRWGHHVGDRVLHEVAAAIKSHLRARDFVARLGGDEFGVILAAVDSAKAGEILQRLRGSVAHHLDAQNLPPVTLSAGYCCHLADAPTDGHAVFAAAAEALRDAKHRGRHCVVAHGAGDPATEP